MIVLSVTKALPWRTYVARIIQGHGGISHVGLLIEASQSFFGCTRDKDSYEFPPHVQIGTYLITVTYSVITPGRKAPEPRALPERLRRQSLHPNDTPIDYLHPRRRVS